MLQQCAIMVHLPVKEKEATCQTNRPAWPVSSERFVFEMGCVLWMWTVCVLLSVPETLQQLAWTCNTLELKAAEHVNSCFSFFILSSLSLWPLSYSLHQEPALLRAGLLPFPLFYRNSPDYVFLIGLLPSLCVRVTHSGSEPFIRAASLPGSKCTVITG